MIEIPIGYRNEKELDFLQLPAYCLISGYGGGSRSGLLYRLVLSGITKYSPEDLQYWIYDDEMHTFDDFKRYHIPHITKLVSEESIEGTQAFLTSLYDEVQRRFQLLLCNQKKQNTYYHTFQEYFQGTGKRLSPQLVVIVDVAEDFHRHYWDSNESIRNLMCDVALLSQALDISLIFCFGDSRRINWGYGLYPHYFQYRISMKQDEKAAQHTLDYQFQCSDPWKEYGTFWINWPTPHPVRPVDITSGDWEEVIKKHFPPVDYNCERKISVVHPD